MSRSHDRLRALARHIGRSAALVAILALPMPSAVLARLEPVSTSSPATAPASLIDARQLETPDTLEELRAFEAQVQRVVQRVLPAVVGVQNGAASGSGVIVSDDGYVLTAGHVAMDSGRPVTLILPDGRRIRAETLGVNRDIDSGMMKILDDGPWPHVEMGSSTDLVEGEWTLALGHPGGYNRDRPPVVRLGRVLANRPQFIRTDAPLVGGDSGGPLFDLSGKLVGIHSRIGEGTDRNIDVPIDAFGDTWDRLAGGEVWGGRFGGGGPMIGVTGADDPRGFRVTAVIPDSPAQRAGVEPGDIITRIDDVAIADFESLRSALARRRPGQRIAVEVLRGDEPMSFELRLMRRPTSG